MRSEERNYLNHGFLYYQEEPKTKRKIAKSALRAVGSSRTIFGFGIFTKSRLSTIRSWGKK